MGISFQSYPLAANSQIIIHVRMLDVENALQQEALGIVGVNLVDNNSIRDLAGNPLASGATAVLAYNDLVAAGILSRLAQLRHSGELSALEPDAKSQVTLEYDGTGKPVRVAVNQDIAEASTPVRGGDEIAFFPPVTGG